MDKTPRLVLVTWVDSVQQEPEWRHITDLPELYVVSCMSVGWFLNENQDAIMLAANVGDLSRKDKSQASGFMRIAKKSIIKIYNLDVKHPTR